MHRRSVVEVEIARRWNLRNCLPWFGHGNVPQSLASEKGAMLSGQ